MSAIGTKRHCPMVVPFHTDAVWSLIGTDLVATVPRRIAELEASNPSLRALAAQNRAKRRGDSLKIDLAEDWDSRVLRYRFV